MTSPTSGSRVRCWSKCRTATAAIVPHAIADAGTSARCPISTFARIIEVAVESSKPQITGKIKRPKLKTNLEWETLDQAEIVKITTAQQAPIEMAKPAVAKMKPSPGPPSACP